MCELETPFIHPLNTALTKRVILFVYWICGARHFQPLHPLPPLLQPHKFKGEFSILQYRLLL